jgi:hypothetical protein
VKEVVAEVKEVVAEVKEVVAEVKEVVTETKDTESRTKPVPEVSKLEEVISLDDIVTDKPLVGGSEPEEISIDTEPASVSFSNYDHVFDEAQEPVG